MKDMKKMEIISEKVIEKIGNTFSKEEIDILTLATEYAFFNNILQEQSEELRYKLYEDLKEEFEDTKK